MKRTGCTAGSLRGPAVLVVMVALFASCTRTTFQAAPVSVRDAGTSGIAMLQARLRAVPRDWQAWAGLGSSYVQEARRSGDPTYYPKAESALRRSLSLNRSENYQAMAGLGALDAARHDFAGALRWGRRAQAIDRYSASVYGVIGDALVELGRYHEAFTAIQKMVDLRPGLDSYARVSYVRELQGDVGGAMSAMQLALDSASSPSDGAFAAYYLGELDWGAGRTSDAARLYQESHARDATFVPALQGLAKVAAARGDVAAALSGYENVIARLPLPQYIGEYADLCELAKRPAQARDAMALLAVQRKLFRRSGVNVDLEEAVFEADHGIGDGGLAAARREWHRRKSVFVADALAWALHANGRDREALHYTKEALRLGTRNASFVFHTGMIERALGRRADAKRDLNQALAINPHFSLRWTPKVPALIKELS